SHLFKSAGTGDGDCNAHREGAQIADHSGARRDGCRHWQMAGKIMEGFAINKSMEDRAELPSRFRFPDGESFPEMQTRISSALERIVKRHNKPQDIIVIVFHADPIKLAVSHFLGLPLDNFQRLSCDTGSLTAIYASESGANLVKLNQRPPFDFLPTEKKNNRK
ncbi:MAG TPA: histidine phosphatase family protein, partial [Anaerolineales bacterium]|nr:histidine phosphatase family protein [Anaerolineales bacterium]